MNRQKLTNHWTFFVYCFFWCTLSQFSLAQQGDTEWSRFRGPNGGGIATDGAIPIEFGPDQNLVWKSKIPNGFSSPVIQGGRIYLTAEEDGDLFTICLNQANGDEIWRKQAPRDRKEKLDPRNHPAAASPVVDGNQLFVFFPDFGVIAYQTDGQELWRQPMGPFTNLYGMGSSPIVVDDLVILVCDQNLDSHVIALDRTDGRVAWKTAREEATSGHCSPIIYRPTPDVPAQILVAGSFNMTAYESTTGKKLWWVDGLCFEMKSTPVMSKDAVFINGFGSPQNELDQKFDIAGFEAVLSKQDGDHDGLLSMKEMPDKLARNFFQAVDLDNDQQLNSREWEYFRNSIASKNSMMAIKLGGKGDMTRPNTLWKYHKRIPQLPSPLLIGQQLVMVSDRGVVTSLDPATGAEQFSGRIPGAAGNYYASPVAGGDKILFATTSGKVAIVEAGDSLDVLAVNDLGEGIYATPAIVDDRIYLRTEQALYCFGEPDDDSSELNDTIKLTFLANEGFLLSANNSSVLIDAFVKDSFYGYGAISNVDYQKMIDGRPPFSDVQLAITTHDHLDHFQVESAIDFLKNHPSCQLLSTEQVILKSRHESQDVVLLNRLVNVWPGDSTSATYREKGIQVMTYRLRHANLRNYEVQNLGVVIQLGKRRVLHVGDAELNESNFEACQFPDQQIDIAILPDWLLGDRSFLDRHIGAKQYVAAHIPAAQLTQAKVSFARSNKAIFVFDQFMAQETFDLGH